MTTSYSQKLRDPRWQKKRLEILQRDDWRCKSCGREDIELQVHHVVYRRIDPWAYPDYCYQTLCAACHPERQEITDKAVDAIRLVLKDVPTQRIENVAEQLFASAMQLMGVE